MQKTEFVDRMKLFPIGTHIKLTCRGNYGDYVETGKLVKVEDNRVFLDHGFSHSYKRIIRIDFCLSSDLKEIKA